MLDVGMLNDRGGALMLALRVSHADAQTCAARILDLNRRIAEAEGFVSLDVIRRDGGLGVDFYVVARFDTAAALEEWRASPAREQFLQSIEALSIVDVSRQKCAGSMVWFEPVTSMPSAPKPPQLWKRWLLSLIAVYPLLLLLVTVSAPLTSGLPEAVRLFIVAFVLTGLTTALIIPWLNVALASWLRRS